MEGAAASPSLQHRSAQFLDNAGKAYLAVSDLFQLELGNYPYELWRLPDGGDGVVSTIFCTLSRRSPRSPSGSAPPKGGPGLRRLGALRNSLAHFN